MRVAVAVFIAVVAVMLATLASGEQTRPVQQYWLQIPFQEPLRAHVKGRISIKDGRLFTGEGGCDQFPRHWAEFVKNLEVSDEAGQALKLSEITDKDSGRGVWSVGDVYTGLATVSYDVDLEFTKTKWDPSNEKAGYFDGKALYIVTKMLFLGSVLDLPVQLHVKAPAGAGLATPWNATDKDQFTFEVPTTFDLQQNTIVLGDFLKHEIRQGNFQLNVALLGSKRESAAIAIATLRKFAMRYGKLFPSTPSSSYLITIFNADSENGESFERSSAFVTARPLAESDIILWGNTQGHELFHFWCGQQISGSQSDQSQWFEEGFTEYYANLSLMRGRMISEDLFVKKMENMLGKYLYFRAVPQFAEVSIRDSGTRKTTYRFGVYNGGWAVAFGLDMTIRKVTGGRKTLDDFMRAMFDRFGLAHKKFSYEELIATANQVAGTDSSSFFHKYVDGKETMPVVEWLRDLGYDALVQDYADEMYIKAVRSTPLKQAWLAEAQ